MNYSKIFNDKAAVLIPTVNPGPELKKLVLNLGKSKFIKNFTRQPKIVVVDDGSHKKESIEILKQIALLPNLEVFRHYKNKGKGKAIKTGLLKLRKDVNFIVTADSDGQHAPDDILKVLIECITSNKYVLGSRNLSSILVPFKSRLGNVLTSILFYLSTGKKIEDTQTGLRGIPQAYFDLFIEIDGDRYEYEFSALLEATKVDIVSTIPIQTIYFENNKGSNFRPVKDSFLIYFLFLRYFYIAFCISVIDLVAIYIATIIFPFTYSFLIIRLISAHIYFYLMKTKVFKSEGKIYFQLSLFYLFSLLNIFISWITFDQIFFVAGNNFFIGYFAGVVIMFFVNFFIQKHIIFKRKNV